MTDDISYARVKFDAESARTYSQRKNGKHRQEMAMIEDAMRHVPVSYTHLTLPTICSV